MTAALWVDASEVAGAIAAVVAVIGGAVVAIFYGSKATVQVSAEAHRIDTKVLLSARPSVSGVGFFRLKFNGPHGAKVRVTEVYASESSSLHDGRFWDQQAIFGSSFVEGGETLTTTALFDLKVPPANVIGWRVSFGTTVTRFLGGKGWSWADQVFVPRPPD